MTGRDLRERWLVTVLLAGALVVPSLWAVLLTAGATSGDIALIELRVRDVFSAHPPFVGAYSRYGWDHPGPLLFWTSALPYRLLGGGGHALRLAVLLLNTVALVALSLVAARRGRAAWFAVAGAAVGLVMGLPADSLASPWNVTVTHLAVIAFAVSCWAFWCGDGRAGWVALVAGSFVLQSHVGVGVVIAPLALATLAAGVVRWWRSGAERVTASWFAGVVGAMWLLPVVIDAAADPPGNLGRIVRWSLTNDEPRTGWSTALELVGRTSSLTFLGEPRLEPGVFLYIDAVDTGWLPGLSLALLLAAGLLAARRGWRSELVWCSIVGSLWLAGTVAAATITLPLGWWLVEWLEPLGWLTWSAIVLTAWRAVESVVPRPTIEHTKPGLALVAFLLLAAGAGVHATDLVRAHDRRPFVATSLDHLADATERAALDTPIAVATAGEPLLAESLLAGYVTALENRGIRACVDAALEYKFGAHRVCDPDAGPDVLLRHEPIVEPPPPAATALAVVDPLTEGQRRDADRITADVTDILLRDGRAGDVALLHTTLPGALLLGKPSAELRARSEDLERLTLLRRIPGDRYGLYQLP